MFWRNLLQRLREIATCWEDCTGRLTVVQARRRIIEQPEAARLRQRYARRLTERSTEHG